MKGNKEFNRGQFRNWLCRTCGFSIGVKAMSEREEKKIG